MTVCMFGNTSKQIQQWTMMACQGRAEETARAIDQAVRLLTTLEAAGASRYERQQLSFTLSDCIDCAIASIHADLDEEGIHEDAIPIDRSELDAAIAKLRD